MRSIISGTSANRRMRDDSDQRNAEARQIDAGSKYGGNQNVLSD